eukprot:gene13921-16008_t
MQTVHVSLSESVLGQIEDSGVVVRKCPGSLPIYDVTDNQPGLSVLNSYWTSSSEMDPVLIPSFGNVMDPYITPAAQVEVLSILGSFQAQNDSDLTGSFPLSISFAVPLGGFQYNQSQTVLLAVQEELQELIRFGRECRALAALPAGHVICDLSIIYANAILAIRMHRQ